jgi:Carboxypeptidase regulatory-like domain
MANKDSAIKVAVITAIGVILAAATTALLNPSWWQSERARAQITDSIIAGRVVDERTNRAIGQASVSIVGRSETGVSADNGNFRISLRPPLPKDGTVRLQVAKPGYAPWDQPTTPTEKLVVQLRQM